MKLPETQVAVLEAASANEPRTVESLSEDLDRKPESITRAAFELADEGLLDVSESIDESVSLTEEGRTYLEDGLPEVRLYEAAIDAGGDDDPVQMGQVIGASGLEGGAVDIALSNFARKGYGGIDSGEITANPDAGGDDPEATALESIAGGDADLVTEDTLDQLERRGLIERSERTVRSVQLTDEGVTALMEGVEVAEEVDRLTSEMLTSGEWRDVEFSEYNVAADAPEIEGGRHHPLRSMAERVKDVLVGMGFSEMQGPHADAEFWINDCLFMPQDHPARTHWDQFGLDVPPMQDLPEDVRERVEAAHREGVGEDGEGYHSPWGEDMARQIDLRGHTTSLSARYLSGIAEGDLEPPQRFFSIEKAYRNDEIDSTHLLEFFQIEGWVMADDLSVRDLMGTFTEFYEQFGITDLRFKPTYNPYTEPSFELFGEHPVTGEVVEIGNSGIFRPEMLEPLDVDCDVMAWGLALERLMMLVTGAEDIRDVHGTLVDLDYLRTEEVRY
ncbi:phenylalanine--tRNA ligase subunit alpha [Halapricum hydrolyticum]|uniref:Phenylalanine--tRNA ligase alpha subunit n=1 Tax=Halapricum hydrolyticum TaxID=2979991 RepID=A0AAE3IBW0_9EURY|nr:phenylalanine--tRNA ligase subunit alpha [Halapricum hydrolyticum]MCU4718688.1 phenylalanine--tRNA ligase subunit alpha [Halapricum hydrolyticum]MCU4727626.1 phenylalanine--tRNA ligase subunit alpha [Halapricum hydrolyticum]